MSAPEALPAGHVPVPAQRWLRDVLVRQLEPRLGGSAQRAPVSLELAGLDGARVRLWLRWQAARDGHVAVVPAVSSSTDASCGGSPGSPVRCAACRFSVEVDNAAASAGAASAAWFAHLELAGAQALLPSGFPAAPQVLLTLLDGWTSSFDALLSTACAVASPGR